MRLCVSVFNSNLHKINTKFGVSNNEFESPYVGYVSASSLIDFTRTKLGLT